MTMARKPVTLFSLDSPFAAPKWPEVVLADQTTILDQLTSLFLPIGQHRRDSQPSQGKRRKQQRRAATAQAKDGTEAEAEEDPKNAAALRKAKALELAEYLSVGFNATNHYLEALVQRPAQRPKPTPENTDDSTTLKRKEPSSNLDNISAITKNLVVVFVCKSALPNSLYTHLPLLIAMASRAQGLTPPIKLVALNKPADVRLAETLGIPRAGFIGLMEGAPGSEELLEYINLHVQPVECSFLEESSTFSYLPLKVKVTETTAPTVVKKPKAFPKTNKTAA